jgi:hypothetical protein
MQGLVDCTAAELKDLLTSKDFLVARITDIFFDPSELKRKLDAVVSQYPPVIKDNYPLYKGVALQYREGIDPHYGNIDSIKYIAGDGNDVFRHKEDFHNHVILNDCGQKFEKELTVLDQYGYKVYLARIFDSRPSCNFPEHIDNDFRLHVPITTNDQATLDYREQSVHFPADGHLYVSNGYKPHGFSNSSLEYGRYHIVGILEPTFPL